MNAIILGMSGLKLTAKGMAVLSKSLLGDFESEFSRTSAALNHQMKVLRDEATLASRTEVHQQLQRQHVHVDALLEHARYSTHQQDVSILMQCVFVAIH